MGKKAFDKKKKRKRKKLYVYIVHKFLCNIIVVNKSQECMFIICFICIASYNSHFEIFISDGV